MEKHYSIAQAKQDLPAIIHEVERTGRARLTRRGRPVAVVLSMAEFERLESSRRKEIQWSAATLDTRGFQFDRDEANAR
ncbi:MAG: type II toxin-antitoxin system prevent-host-death family antitoxin [Betaproteobacteria bacterium]|nr:type II toxin-antitoxin system prevent-host-death family antitoxin [Betaproteobacteria bacterium]MBI2959707.1 type II toxin-antitoxin system prevent-host-death family antitoxin [Betaproteobacteria bacterium]